jgi:hypothetical protein
VKRVEYFGGPADGAITDPPAAISKADGTFTYQGGPDPTRPHRYKLIEHMCGADCRQLSRAEYRGPA